MPDILSVNCPRILLPKEKPPCFLLRGGVEKTGVFGLLSPQGQRWLINDMPARQYYPTSSFLRESQPLSLFYPIERYVFHEQ